MKPLHPIPEVPNERELGAAAAANNTHAKAEPPRRHARGDLRSALAQLLAQALASKNAEPEEEPK